MSGDESPKNGAYSASRSAGYKSSSSRYSPMKNGREHHRNGHLPHLPSSSSACFKCGEDGHFSRECPKSGGAPSSSSGGCYKCGEKGHFSRECPKNGGSGRPSSGCFKCGEQGHISRDCPKSGGDRDRDSRSHRDGGRDRDSRPSGNCFKCGEPGHISRDCKNSSGGRGGDRDRDRERGSGRDRDGPSNDFGIKFGQAGAGLPKVDWSAEKLTPFQRDFYTESANTANRPDSEVEEWKKENDIECLAGYHDSMKGAEGDDHRDSWNKRWNDKDSNHGKSKNTKPIPKPIMAFKDASFPHHIQAAIDKAGFDAPTAIQSLTWPILLSGNNVIGIARTGSGKTLAFLMPAMIHIAAQPPVKRGDGPVALVIAPTRELAVQIEGEVNKFASRVRHCCVYGGAGRYQQKRTLYGGVSIIIATPGRLLDFIESGVTHLRRVTYCVIDEADRLLDMGFEPQLNAIMNQIRPDRQMMMFSATWPKDVRQLAKKYMVKDGDDSNVFQIAIGGSFSRLQANENVTQQIEFYSKTEKIEKLKKHMDDVLKEDKEAKILVFVATKKMTNYLYENLWQDGYWATCIHGDKQQSARDRALNDFKSGKMKILLATDVASRGIHVDDIKLVVNFDFPTHIEDYVHRIGRTGRAGAKGVAITFFDTEEDAPRAKDLIKVLKDAKQEVPEKLYKYQHSKGGNKRYGRQRFGRYGGGFGGGGGGGRRW